MFYDDRPRIKIVVTLYCYNFYKEGKAIMNNQGTLGTGNHHMTVLNGMV